MKSLQIISDEAIQRGQSMTTMEIVRFLDEFRRLHGTHSHGNNSDKLSVFPPPAMPATDK